jgi:hypothetical protein
MDFIDKMLMFDHEDDLLGRVFKRNWTLCKKTSSTLYWKSKFLSKSFSFIKSINFQHERKKEKIYIKYITKMNN